MSDDTRVIVALDFASVGEAESFVATIQPGLCHLKVGKELFARGGPEFVRRLVGAGFKVFLDLKYHDIPNTVARACTAACELGVWMLNVHALGGRRMMEAAREAVAEYGQRHGRRPLLIGVTVLTSMAGEDLAEVGLGGEPRENVLRLAALAQSSGLDGVVCSPLEAGLLSEKLGEAFCLVTPGVRPAGGDKGDQRRVMTPGEAIREGASYLVVGRPITQAADPVGVLLTINSEIADTLRA